MFNFWKKKDNRHPINDNPLINELFKSADYIMDNEYINEDSIAYVRMTLETAKLRAQQEMDLYSFVADECEKLAINCKDEKFVKIENAVIEKMKIKMKEMKSDHERLVVSYLNLIKSLEMVRNDLKKEK